MRWDTDFLMNNVTLSHTVHLPSFPVLLPVLHPLCWTATTHERDNITLIVISRFYSFLTDNFASIIPSNVSSYRILEVSSVLTSIWYP